MSAAALRTFASETATAIYNALDNTRAADDLDRLASVMWRGYGEGQISEEDATFLGTCIDRQRPRGDVVRLQATKTALRGLASRFTPRQRPRSPDRKASRDRRRMLGLSSVLPPQLRCAYTVGQNAVLAVIAGEVKHHGICDLPNDKIAALAGVCRTTVQTTLHEARRLFHIKIRERPQWRRKSLTNVVTIISGEWLMWLKRGPTAHRPLPTGHIGSNSFFSTKSANLVSTTKSIDSDSSGRSHASQRAERAQEAVRREPWARSGAP